MWFKTFYNQTNRTTPFGRHYQVINLFADNCGSQNKSVTMVNYLLWRVMTGQITLSFMIPGYIKFSSDCYFSLMKK